MATPAKSTNWVYLAPTPNSADRPLFIKCHGKPKLRAAQEIARPEDA